MITISSVTPSAEKLLQTLLEAHPEHFKVISNTPSAAGMWVDCTDVSQWENAASIRLNKQQSRIKIVADADCDADGSPRAKEIDPGNGQYSTSLASWGGWKGKGAKADGDIYVDSETVPYFVLPLKFHQEIGIEKPLMGCIAKISWNGKSVFAILADEGPSKKIGEASIKTLESLGFDPWNSAKTKVVRGIPSGVTYDVFYTKRDLNRCVDFDSIQKYGKEVFGEQCPAMTYLVAK